MPKSRAAQAKATQRKPVFQEPVFQGFHWFMAEGGIASIPSDSGAGFGPQVVDLDGDGRKDILSGSWPGELYFFAGTKKGFARPRLLVNRAGKVLQPGSASTVFAADWNRDGRLDLVCGNRQGEIRIYPGLRSSQKQGASRQLHFGVERQIRSGDTVIHTPGGSSSPILADWDGDGHLDLLTGSGSGQVLYYRNLAVQGPSPRYSAAQILIQGGSRDGKMPGLHTRICAYDWNRDGKLDLLVGDFLAAQTPSPVAPPNQSQKAAKLQKLRLLQLQILTLRLKVHRKTASKADSQKLTALLAEKKDLLTPRYEKPTQTSQSRRGHGHVFLFLRN